MRVLPLAFATLATSVAAVSAAADRLPILDMHLHARAASYAGEDPPPMCTPFEVMPRWNNAKPPGEGFEFAREPCAKPIPAAKTDADVMAQTIEVMKRRNIIGMVSGEPEAMKAWKAAAPDRIIVGLDLRIGAAKGAHSHVAARTVADVRELHDAKAFEVLGEVMAQYEGVAADDPRLEPYWALAEARDIPVGIHIGPGEPAGPYGGAGTYRARHSSALVLEDVLVRHPKLRVYIMHAGYPLLEDLRALLFTHPQVYLDVSSIVYTEPRPAFYRYLEGIVEAGYGDRVMFGSDQMIWPGIIEPAIAAIEDAPFLDEKQKRAILYDNAARFLRLTPAQMAEHHRMGVDAR